VGHTLPAELATDLGIPALTLQRIVQNRYFGGAWADIQAASPFLARRRVRFFDLPRQIAYARELLGQLAKPEALYPEGDPMRCNT
jgi:hypothetical protein